MVNLQRKLVSADKIDIGCGKTPKKGFAGIDIVDFGQPIIWDISQGLPFPNNSIIEVYSSHFVEHLQVGEIDDFISEVMRVCVTGAKIVLRCPHAETDEAYFSCHNSLWNEQRIKGICHGRRCEKKYLKIERLEKDGIDFIMELEIVCD